MNTVIDTIMSRKSIRAYKPEQISQEQLESLIKVALNSPTAINTQNWHFSVVQDFQVILELEKDIVKEIMAGDNEDAKKRIESRAGKTNYDAPTLIVLSAKPTAYSHIDAGIAVASLAIAAKSMGLDSVILGMPGLAIKGQRGAYWKEKLAFPAEFEFTIAIAIGYGAMAANEKSLDPSKVTHIK